MNFDQIDFAFVADLPTAPVRSKRGAKPRKLVPAQTLTPHTVTDVAAAQALPSQTHVPDAEVMANVLDAHPDYRVLRRLKPCFTWPSAQPGQSLSRVVLLDTETTGLDPSKDKVIELALLRVDVDTATGMPVGVVDVYDGLEDPGIAIPPEIEAITGIGNAMVQGQRLDIERIAQLMEGVDLVIAHNAAFDRPFVEDRIAGFSQHAWACSLADIRWKDLGRSSAKLESLALEMGYFYDAHRAEMDCHALLAVLACPLPKLPCTGLAHLLQAAVQTSYRLQASFAPFEAKDALKSRGYRWNAEQKVWTTHLDSEQALLTESAWLKERVYGGRTVSLQVEKLDALTRYSHRLGALIQHTL